MKSHLILMLVSIYLTSAIRPDMKYSNDRERFIRFRNMPPVLAVRRNSQGQPVSFLPYGPRVLFRPHARYFILPPRVVSGRNSRVNRPTPRLMTPTMNHGTSSLTAVNVGSSRNVQRNRFFTVPTRSRPLVGTSFRSHIRIPTPRLSMTRSGWSRRIILPQNPFPRESGNKISKSSVDFLPGPAKTNDSDMKSSNVSEKEGSAATLTDSQSAPISSRSGFQPLLQPRSSNTRALSAPQSIFFSPRVTNVGFGPRSSTNYRYINRHFGPRAFHGNRPLRPPMFPLSRTMFATRLGTPFQESRSVFRPSAAINHDSVPLPGFSSFDRGIPSGSWSGISPLYTLSKSHPLVGNSIWSRFGGATNPRSNSIQTMANFMDPSLARISKSNQSVSKINATVDIPKYITADYSNGTARPGNGNSSESFFHIIESELIPNGEDQPNQTLVHFLLNGVPNVSRTHLGNATEASTPDTDPERPNAESPVQNIQGLDGAERSPLRKNSLSTGSQDVEKLSWLTEIANTAEALEEALDDDDLISRLRRSGPHTYASLMAALRKGSPFYDEIIADLKSEGQWDELLKAAGISPNDQDQQESGVTAQHGSKLDWLTELVNKKEGLDEAIDEGKLVTRLRKTGPHTYDGLMDALRKGSHFSDRLISDMKSEGEWRIILQAAGINSTRDTRQNRMSKTVNMANEIEVKPDQMASLQSSNTDVQSNQPEHGSVSTDQHVVTFGSAAAIDQIPNISQSEVSQGKSVSGSSKGTTPSDSSVTVSRPKNRDLHTRSVPTNTMNRKGKAHGPKYWRN